MIGLVLLLATQQGGPWVARPASPTVGDTVVLGRVVPIARGGTGRTHPVERTELVEPLEAPVVGPAEDGLLVLHRLVLFAPGDHALAMPGVEVVHADGTVELVEGDTAFVTVTAVIPDTLAEPRPRPSQAPLARRLRRLERALAPIAVVLLALALWVARRRRAPRQVPGPPPAEPVPEPPLMRWMATGERRAVATLAALRLRRAVADRPPEAEWAEILGALERARFAPLAADDLAELVDRVDQMVARVAAAAAPPGAAA